jgi:hypothetical protein
LATASAVATYPAIATVRSVSEEVGDTGASGATGSTRAAHPAIAE